MRAAPEDARAGKPGGIAIAFLSTTLLRILEILGAGYDE
jgi:hypothetical protein